MPLDRPLAERLLVSATKAFARLPHGSYDEACASLAGATSVEEFHDALADLDWGMAPQAKREVLASLRSEDWEDMRGRLLKALDHQRIERMSPSS